MKKCKNYLLVVLIIVLLLIYLLFSIEYHFSIPCIFHKLTGLYCPGCGITRMFYSLIKGEFYQAFRYNPGIFVLLPFLVIYFFDFIISLVQNKTPYLDKKISKKIWMALLIYVLLYGILRNLSWFSFLEPTIIY